MAQGGLGSSRWEMKVRDMEGSGEDAVLGV